MTSATKILTLLVLYSMQSFCTGENRDANKRQDALKITPSSLFSRDFWPMHSALRVWDWLPLDVVQQMEDCEEVVRVISFGGWEGSWSVTTCSGLRPNPDEDYRKTGKTLHFQHRIFLANQQATMIHRIALEVSELNKHLNPKALENIFMLKLTDFDSGAKQTKDAPFYIIERIRKNSYSLVVRQFGDLAEPELSSFAKDLRDLALSKFKDDLAVLPQAQKNP